MLTLNVTDRAGKHSEIRSAPGGTLMEAIRDSGFSDAFAICGGCLSCATCHVYIRSASEGALPPLGEDEDDLLSETANRLENSRLSCQIFLTELSDGMSVTIAPAEE